MSDHPHRRYNPLSDRWVLVSPQRDQRPWQGQVEDVPEPEPQYREDCYLCPGNPRAGGQQNPDYAHVFVFDNDFPALLPDEVRPAGDGTGGLFRSDPVRGRCRVICYSPRHDLTLGRMSKPELLAVIETWARETALLSRDYPCVQIFENRGATMGCSNAHPHGQIWAMDALPGEIKVEEQQQAAYFEKHATPLLLDYARQEMAQGERSVCANKHWLAVVPWWATWPFEILLLPLEPVSSLPALSNAQRDALALILQQLLGTYDQLFAVPFPYSMGWHGAPGSVAAPHWQLHAHFYPPLLRSATVRKHMVGFEMLGESQRDLTPERAAEQLRRALS
ncbi:UDP-glucose--hexose-1-phosphate uridylyltransferase [Congregibacter litoralis]|uniref:Galactose-1-phosphate uridylyltransferase n=1 Tax=Congregibacter litoralis KT71 TaxID=314285 RepID=A4AD87_9GAMM|nr:UDP-glucose--hexose-1-phosphate uridylyltransferase [Congregibacter litoralis]EAQ96011.1 galactose-1-phosphate uridylyltransferase, family 1 [Congregibacter litoralis KT71]